MKQNNLSPIQLACKKLFDIDLDYFENIPCDGETLPLVTYPGTDEVKTLAIDYRDHVVAAFKRDLDEILTPEAVKNITVADAVDVTKQLDKIQEPIYTPHKLLRLYNNANRITVREMIVSDNKADIIAFVHALQDVTVWECKRFLAGKIPNVEI